MSLKGHLGTIALPELLQWLAIGQKTGTLVIVENDGVHRIAVDRGRIISTSTSDPKTQLGHWLLERELVDGATLERARKLREATGMSLGRVLLTLQAVEEEELRQALHEKAEALISALFHSTNASFQFVEDGDLGDPGVMLSLDATQLVLSAAHHLERQREAEAATAAGAPPDARDQHRATAPPRATPPKTTATVIETLPENFEPGPLPRTGAAPDRRRALGGLTAAALLVAAVAAVLLVGRSHVPAKAEESVDRVAAAVRDLAPLAAGEAAARPARQAVELPELDLPLEPPPVAEDELPTAAGSTPEVAAEEARLKRLLAEREAEVRNEYDAELEALREQLAAARSPAPAKRPPVVEPVAPAPTPGPAAASPKDELLRAQDAPPTDPPPPAEPNPEPAAEPPIKASEPPEARREAVAAATPPGGSVSTAPTATERTPARLLSREPPLYPAAARRLGREARVTLRVLVGADGRVEEIETVGRKAGLGFDEAARAAARSSRWQPATENGSAVSSWVDLRFDFELP